MLEPHTKIEVRYYLDSRKELVWFPGQVETVHGDSIEVLFESIYGFDATRQSFKVKNNTLQDTFGELYPFKSKPSLPKKANVKGINEGSMKEEHQDNDTVEQDKGYMDNGKQVLNDIGSNERILSVLSLKMNSAIRTLSKHVITIEDFGSLTQQLFSVSTDCSLLELDSLLEKMKARGISAEVNPSDTSTFPVQVSVNVGCFHKMCSMLSISDISAEQLLYSSKYNRKKKMIHCRFLGTAYSNQMSATDPLVLCIGGNYWEWDKRTVAIVRNNQKQAMNRFISSLKIISTATEFGTFKDYFNKEKGSFFGLEWKAFETETICNAHRSKGSFFGNLKLLIPLVQIRNVRFANDMDRLMGKHVSAKESSDEDSEDTDQSD